jgi:hypothetical protein
MYSHFFETRFYSYSAAVRSAPGRRLGFWERLRVQLLHAKDSEKRTRTRLLASARAEVAPRPPPSPPRRSEYVVRLDMATFERGRQHDTGRSRKRSVAVDCPSRSGLDRMVSQLGARICASTDSDEIYGNR